MSERPTLLITMGDVAGIGPEIIAKAWPHLQSFCRPIVIGDPFWLQRQGMAITQLAEIPSDPIPPETIPIIHPSTLDLSQVQQGQISAAAGQAACDFLCYAIDQSLLGHCAGIVTCPLHKEGLHRAGLPYPGHTEILAERTGAASHAMALYGDGVLVAHVTLHVGLRDGLAGLTPTAVYEKILLVKQLLLQLNQPVKIACGSVNPHASDGGLFGNEEVEIILPAIERAKQANIEVIGPIPNDAIFQRAYRGEFAGIVAMYHDAGHIAMKLHSGMRCVNITAGLPIIRTSVAHGTAYDIVGKNLANPKSLIAATQVASQLARNRNHH